MDDRPGGPSRLRPYTYSYFGQAPNVQDQQGAKGFEYGGVYRSLDGGETWDRVNSLHSRPMYFRVLRVDPSDAQRVYVLGVSQFRSENGGVTFEGDFGRGVHADGHDLWIDPRDGRHMIIGCDGGLYATHDRGRNWDHINTSAIGQVYHVAISLKAPYQVVGGLQDNGTWLGPSLSQSGGGPINEDWVAWETSTDRTTQQKNGISGSETRSPGKSTRPSPRFSDGGPDHFTQWYYSLTIEGQIPFQ